MSAAYLLLIYFLKSPYQESPPSGSDYLTR